MASNTLLIPQYCSRQALASNVDVVDAAEASAELVLVVAVEEVDVLSDQTEDPKPAESAQPSHTHY